MDLLVWCFAAGAVWSLWALAARAIVRGPRAEPVAGVAWWATRAYARLWHGLKVKGKEYLPPRRDTEPGRHAANGALIRSEQQVSGTRREVCGASGPLIVVANHTAGVDPILIQSACPFEIRWMMARDMDVPALRQMWDWIGVIFVDRDEGREAPSRAGPLGTAAHGVREALRHLSRGGVLGVFPEGRIERPRGKVLPFRRGLDLLIARSGATVLPVIVRGTPVAHTAWGSLVRRSRASIEFLPVLTDLRDATRRAEASAMLHEMFVQRIAAERL